ncbi:MAG: oligosaccharide repeat unit polymerase [Lachnospiraceae bacterium]|nr:oligosaccharide repeat unit polymerase [Lachnospiraceae bacterium]
MLLIYTILYFVSMMLYYLKQEIIASVIMISLAIFLYVSETRVYKRIINVRGLFALGFIGGFGLSLLKLSKLSQEYNIITFLAIYISYFSLYLGVYLEGRNKKLDNLNRKVRLEKKDTLFTSQEILLIVLFVITLASFVIEAIILKFIPVFTLATPHAYSSFHVFMLHYITTFYSFIPCFAICNYYIEPERKQSKVFVIVSFVYVIIMSLLLVSRSQLILSLVLSLFIVVIYKTKTLKKIVFNKKNIFMIVASMLLFLVLYMAITISRAHNVEYLNGIFEMKNEKMPIFITQPYMYVAHNFENLNYMINNIFRFSFGRRMLYPFFTLTFVKKFFPIVVDAPYYIIKEELSTVTIIYDAYYDFGLVGVAIFCFLLGYIGKKLEDRAYKIFEEEQYKNNYILIIFSLFCYYMFFSFFQTYFSLTDTWVYIIILSMIILLFQMTKSANTKSAINASNKNLNSRKRLDLNEEKEGI